MLGSDGWEVFAGCEQLQFMVWFVAILLFRVNAESARLVEQSESIVLLVS